MALPLAGQKILAADLSAIFPNDTDAWDAYVPTWTPGTLGNGTLTGAYMKIGRAVLYRIHFVWGSTTTAPAGAFIFTLPTLATNTGHAGGARILDAAPAVQYYRHVFVNSGNQIGLSAEAASTFVQATVPITFATGDQILINGSYESTT